MFSRGLLIIFLTIKAINISAAISYRRNKEVESKSFHKLIKVRRIAPNYEGKPFISISTSQELLHLPTILNLPSKISNSSPSSLQTSSPSSPLHPSSFPPA